MRILGETLRECSIFLYDQWYHLSEERYEKLKEEFPQFASQTAINGNNDDHKMDIEEPKNEVNKKE